MAGTLIVTREDPSLFGISAVDVVAVVCCAVEERAGYDGDAAELVHISADGVAVVSLVHDGEGGGVQVDFEQGLGLIEVGHVCAGEHEAQRVTEGVARHVDLGREAGARTAHGLGQLTAGGVRPVCMHAHGGAVHHERPVITQACRQTSQHCCPQAVAGPTAEAVISRLPRSEEPRQIPPWRPGPHDPEHPLNP